MVAFSTFQHSLQSVFPEWVLSHGVTLPLPGAPLRFDGPEQVCVAGATARRQHEFIAGRLCARATLRALGYDDFPLMMDRDRMPRWPSDVSGSISHTSAACAAAAARKTSATSIGLDIEQCDRVTPDLWPYIATPDELRWILARKPAAREKWAALVFSAKECFYKCQYPVTRRWLDFHDAQISVRDGERWFEVRVRESLPGLPDHVLIGRYRFTKELVITGMFLRTGRGRV